MSEGVHVVLVKLGLGRAQLCKRLRARGHARGLLNDRKHRVWGLVSITVGHWDGERTRHEDHHPASKDHTRRSHE